MNVLEALRLAVLRLRHTTGTVITPFGHKDVFDDEGKLLFGKVTGIVAGPACNCFDTKLIPDGTGEWKQSGRWTIPFWQIAGVAVEE